MITNLVAVVVITLATNWTTVSRTTPVVPPEQVMYAIAHYDTLNQVGTVVTNYVAEVIWKGTTKQLLLESVPCRDCPQQNRAVFENPWAAIGFPGDLDAEHLWQQHPEWKIILNGTTNPPPR